MWWLDLVSCIFSFIEMSFGKCCQKIPPDSLVCMCVHLQNLTLRPWIQLCCWLKPGFHIVVSVVPVVRKKFIGQIQLGYLRTTELFYILNANETPKNTRYSRNDKILKTRENEKRCSMGKRLTNAFNSKKKKKQFGKVATHNGQKRCLLNFNF